MSKFVVRLKGGPGSGFRGHGGRPGKRGGSAPKGAGGIFSGGTVKQLQSKYPKTFSAIHELMLDNDMRLNTDASISVSDEKRFAVAETVIADMSGKTVGDIVKKSQLSESAQDYYDMFEGDSAMEAFVAGDDDYIQAIVSSYGDAGKATNELINDIFEGDLDLEG